MRSSLVKFFDKAIEFLFYSLFFLVPIVFSGNTSELFEFNKMWVTFAIGALVAFFWLGKMVVKREIFIQRTPLDIPILLFLLSQTLSTIFSLDSHVSLWGYYSRFNGGLLSIISYIFLYYAFASNLFRDETKAVEKNKNENVLRNLYNNKIVRKMLLVSIASGVFVSLWGLPSHFGFDPTCKIFRGTLDVSCWTADFQPKVRIFSTMGQPDWLAAYLDILIPISIAFAISIYQKGKSILSRENISSLLFIAISVLFYVDLLFTRARSGIIAFWVSMAVFLGFFVYQNLREKKSLTTLLASQLSAIIVIFIIFTFFIGSSIGFLDKFDFESVKATFSKKTAPSSAQTPPQQKFAGELGGTDSGKIRLIVWKGALDIWKNNPILGTGVETFAFSYYKYRPPAHNQTSEWNFLYNKAHNEFLNFMATTGTLGILTYLSITFLFLLIVASAVFPKLRKKTNFLEKTGASQAFPTYEANSTLVIALTASFVSIIVTNFFGFSVVITNIYLFMLPPFALALMGIVSASNSIRIGGNSTGSNIPLLSWIALLVLLLPTVYTIVFLANSWMADTKYALGYNLDHAAQYQQAYASLHNAVKQRPDEPVFKDEMSINDAVLASILVTSSDQKNKEQNQAIAQSLAQEAIATSNQLTTDYPNNIIFWKTKVRIYYTLSQLNSSYLPLALKAIQKTAELAPTEASIQYNLGVITGQSGDSKKAVEVLERTNKLRPGYTDVIYALGLFYHELGIDKNGKIIDLAYEKKAEDQMTYLLTLDPKNTRASQTLSAWRGGK